MDLHPSGDAWHLCYCVVVFSGGAMTVNECTVPVNGHDQPFCDDCADRHPQWVANGGAIVRTRALARIPSPRTSIP